MIKPKNILMVGLLCLSLAACATTSPSTASSSEPVTEVASFNIAELSCWDLLTANDEDIGFAMVLLYGFEAGKSGQTALNSDDIASAIGSAETFCAANPDSAALLAFK